MTNSSEVGAEQIINADGEGNFEARTEDNPYRIIIRKTEGGRLIESDWLACSPCHKVTCSFPHGWRNAWKMLRYGLRVEVEVVDSHV